MQRAVRRRPKRLVLYDESEKIHWRWTCLEYDARYVVIKFEEAVFLEFFLVFLDGGFAKRGVRTNPPNPPLVTGLQRKVYEFEIIKNLLFYTFKSKK